MDHLTRKEKSLIKQRYMKIYPQLESKVNEFDPIGLISGGAPIDEYDCLTTQLLSKLYSGTSSSDIYEFILHELEHHFGFGSNKLNANDAEVLRNDILNFSVNVKEWFEQLE